MADIRLALVGARHDDAFIEVVYLFVDGPPDQRIELRVLLDIAPAANSFDRAPELLRQSIRT
jgi:hypothetical protein